MIYVLAPNQTVETYPYSIGALRRDNPNTSFPRNPSDEVLASWNVFPVTEKPAPDYNPATENCTQVDPTLVDDQWVMTWAVTPATPEQVTQRTEAKAAELRQQRNQLLSACDWTQLPDVTSIDTNTWIAYRKALRDLTSQPGFPHNVNWPEEP